MMPPRFLIVLLPLLSGACALPPPLQVATWAADGISYMMTSKSVSDHGLSAVAGRDCALHRAVTEGAVCREGMGDAGQAIAAASTRTPGITE